MERKTKKKPPQKNCLISWNSRISYVSVSRIDADVPNI